MKKKNNQSEAGYVFSWGVCNVDRSSNIVVRVYVNRVRLSGNNCVGFMIYFPSNLLFSSWIKHSTVHFSISKNRAVFCDVINQNILFFL